jgi:hypothetical protein
VLAVDVEACVALAELVGADEVAGADEVGGADEVPELPHPAATSPATATPAGASHLLLTQIAPRSIA